MSSPTPQRAVPLQAARYLRTGEDLYGEQRGLGISQIDIKVSTPGQNGVLIMENRLWAPGGPPRHFHYDQEEYFYARVGEWVLEVGEERFTLKAGDSVLAPRRVPHVWRCISPDGGSMLFTFLPAGKMEAFFREVLKANAMPPQDPALWRTYGMELVGPPLV